LVLVKNFYLSCIALVAAGTHLSAADFFFSFDTQQNGSGTYTSVVTTNNGFSGTPVFTRGGTLSTPNMDGGATFTDFAGLTWNGSGGSSAPGHSSGWNNGSVNNAFAVTFSTIGLENITVRYDIRSAAQAGGTPPTSFTSFGYDLGAGVVEIPGAHMSFTADNQFHTWSLDLSSLDAIENQPSVKLRWAFEDLAVSPVESLRVDNIQVSAVTIVPEPGSLTLLGLGAAMLGGLAWRRSRRAR
jgi:hypothetical protein